MTESPKLSEIPLFDKERRLIAEQKANAMFDKSSADHQTLIAKVARDELESHAKDEPIVKYFAWAHLPPFLQTVSKPFGDLALEILKLPRSAERAAGLRKLIEAKDCIVRAALP